MCQQFEGESRFVANSEMQAIRERYARHESGEALLTEAELKDLTVRMLMLRDR